MTSPGAVRPVTCARAQTISKLSNTNLNDVLYACANMVTNYEGEEDSHNQWFSSSDAVLSVNGADVE